MQSFKIYKNLACLNKLNVNEAESVFRDCCGSRAWARRMAESRPFLMIESLYQRADTIWYSLSASDYLEAFGAHPVIGAKYTSSNKRSQFAEWSSGEQSGMDAAGDAVRDDLAEANRLYLAKFGFIFIVCATGRSADEMLAICRARLGNSLETEMKIAAEEQRKITEIRLNNLLEK